jgi:hypothetical protein
MKKILMLFLILLPLRLLAPENRCLYVSVGERINPYTRLIYAINMVEAKVDSVRFDTLAYNREEDARGAFQIRICRLESYNMATGKSYKPEDLFNYEVSKEIFLFYAIPYDNNFRQIAKNWNGSGPATEKYWQKVKKWL